MKSLLTVLLIGLVLVAAWASIDLFFGGFLTKEGINDQN